MTDKNGRNKNIEACETSQSKQGYLCVLFTARLM